MIKYLKDNLEKAKRKPRKKTEYKVVSLSECNASKSAGTLAQLKMLEVIKEK